MKKTVLRAAFMILALLCGCAGEKHGAPSGGEDAKSEFSAVVIEPEKEEERIVTNYTDLKGIWVSQFDMESVYKKGGVQRSMEEYRAAAARIVRDISDMGFNTVFLQIRPNGDSFCKSDLFPASRYVTGRYGRELEYDPVDIFLEEAHALSLSVQAWINPMRLMTPEEVKLIDARFAVRRMYEAGELVEFEGRLYLDPARGDALALVLDGAKEALIDHTFDGLHIDDYFYPTQEERFDKATFAASGETSLERFRKNNINALVRGLYRVAKDVDERLLFGVSPAGNLGSVVQKYSADVYEWCSRRGYLDYILPQLYFGLEHGVCPFDAEAAKWATIVKDPGVKLYIGMSLGKAVAGSKDEEDKWASTPEGKREWIEHKDVLARCMRYLAEWGKADGWCFFCLSYFIDPLTGEPNPYSAAEAAGIEPYIKGEQS
ncbi:MAG: family 10 glycosylhydrolase [Clostridia bacterium]|nr:family 10 glycosylhydrolase [Clostridia bacterium]